MKTLRQIYESLRFALSALRANILRTILTLLGVTVGIFAIIAVLTLVDSLEKNIKDSFNFIGTGVIYLEKWPWVPDDSGEYKWWDFWKRPNTSYAEYKLIQENVKHASEVAILSEKHRSIIKRNSSSIGQVRLMGCGENYDKVYEVNIDGGGRYFTNDEIINGKNVAVIGHEVANTLFPNGEVPLGQTIKVKNMRYTVVGVVKKEGQSFLGTPSNDYSVLIPYQSFRRLYQTGNGRWYELESSVAMKGYDTDLGLVELENEVRGLMRGRRGLKPAEKDNFSINRPEAIMNIVGNFFDVVGMAGWVIGGFSMLVGGFGIANIMFVSVKERTSIIGLQKSLGAKNYFILFQFLFEAVFLSLIGGLAGLFFVYLITLIPMGSLQVTLTFKNILLGLTVSSIIGLVSGLVPAVMAARLDPVVAIRAV